MHEYSIVMSLIESCEQHAKENDSEKVTKISIKIGVMSGVEPHLLKEAFNAFREKTVCESAELDIHIQDVVVLCNSCQKESTLKKREYLCPNCESAELKVLDGEEMYLMSLELESVV